MAYEVTLITGDGTGPELAEAARRCVDATGVKINWDVQEAGVDVMARTGTPLPAAALIRDTTLARSNALSRPCQRCTSSIAASPAARSTAASRPRSSSSKRVPIAVQASATDWQPERTIATLRAAPCVFRGQIFLAVSVAGSKFHVPPSQRLRVARSQIVTTFTPIAVSE